MGVDTKIYSNHNLKIPGKSEDLVELLQKVWQGRIHLDDRIEVDEKNTTLDAENFNLFINPKRIDFEFNKWCQITIGTDFEFSMDIYLHKNTICIRPFGIGRYATNMIVEFMDEPFGIYADDPVGFHEQKKNWNLFKSFLTNLTAALGSDKHLYINDQEFQGIQDLATDGATLEEMVIQTKSIANQCETQEQFVKDHTLLRPDGVRNIKGDVWFLRNERIIEKKV